MFEQSIMQQIETLCSVVSPIETERVSLSEAPLRILAQDLIAAENVPPFRRSPLDGYALRHEDVRSASKETPVTLAVTEEIAAGSVPHYEITQGKAARIMTGAPLPDGADCVIMYELTEFTQEEVRIFQPLSENENVILPGEDIEKGAVLARAGRVIDAGLCGTLASQNNAAPLVYKIPKVGIIPTGSELVMPGEERVGGMIYDSNGYTLSTVLKKNGLCPILYGIAGDDPKVIAEKIETALSECDALLLTGGVSAGDFDYTPEAMEKAGVRILFRGAKLKPGMACAYGEKGGKIACALSGNPVSSLINFLVIALPALRKLTGRSEYEHREMTVGIKGDFPKGSKGTRLVHGVLDFSDGTVRMDLTARSGNVILSGTIGCNAVAVIPAGSGPLAAGTKLKAFLV